MGIEADDDLAARRSLEPAPKWEAEERRTQTRRIYPPAVEVDRSSRGDHEWRRMGERRAVRGGFVERNPDVAEKPFHDASGPSVARVRPSLRLTTRSPSMTAARNRVAPRSTAMTAESALGK